MAHWAEIDENSIVLRVTVGSNEDFDEGYSWLIENLGGTWIQTWLLPPGGLCDPSPRIHGGCFGV